jgi:Rieske 2Fe-2S family protein
VSGLQAALPREMYVDQAAWARERERVLFTTWACVGRVDDLGLDGPGRLAVVDVVGESVVLTRDDDGLHAAYNVCRHRGSQLVPVTMTGGPGAEPVCTAAGALRCPYHSWTYSLAGRLLKAPHTDGPDGAAVDAEEFSLHPVAVEDWAGFVFVNLTPGSAEGGEPFGDGVAKAATNLGNYHMGSLVTGLTLTYDVAANWKVIAENYNECYHCGPVHPELVRLVPAFGAGGLGSDGKGLEWDDGIPHREGAWTFTMSGTTNRAPLPGLSEAEKVRHKGELVYPNLMLSCSADHVAAFVLRPLAVDRTRIDCSLLFARDAASAGDFDPSDAGDFWDLVNKQDWAICESVQRGMSSRAYTHGWFAPMEDDSADIRRWLLPRLGTESSDD